MKLLIKLVSIFFLSFLIGSANPQVKLEDNPEKTIKQDQDPVKKGQDKKEKEQETGDTYFTDDDILFQNLHQKKLPPMTQKEKIIWSFKLAKDRIFL
jgi:hypothetical protein